VLSLFKFNSATNILIVQTKDATNSGLNSFTLAVRLTNYPEKGYFTFTNTFTVDVVLAILTPDYATNYNYVIGSKMLPKIYKLNSSGLSSIIVNGTTENVLETYGNSFNHITQNLNTEIFWVSY
jgi:hypothetical protein